MKNPKLWLGIALSLVTTLIVATLVGVGAYFFGRFQGFRDGMQFAASSHREPAADAAPVAPTTRGPGITVHPGAKRREGASTFSAPPQAPGVQPAPDRQSQAAELGVPTIRGDEDDLTGQMAQLDQLLSKMVPDSAVPPPKPSAATLAMIKRGTKSDADAVSRYLKEVKAILDASGGLSSQELAAGLQAGDEKTYAKAMVELGKSYEKLKAVTVPPSCVELQASYLTLIPDLRSLFALQRRAQEEADMSLMLESLSLAKRVMAMQKQVQRLEGQLHGSQKG